MQWFSDFKCPSVKAPLSSSLRASYLKILLVAVSPLHPLSTDLLLRHLPASFSVTPNISSGPRWKTNSEISLTQHPGCDAQMALCTSWLIIWRLLPSAPMVSFICKFVDIIYIYIHIFFSLASQKQHLCTVCYANVNIFSYRIYLICTFFFLFLTLSRNNLLNLLVQLLPPPSFVFKKLDFANRAKKKFDNLNDWLKFKMLIQNARNLVCLSKQTGPFLVGWCRFTAGVELTL